MSGDVMAEVDAILAGAGVPKPNGALPEEQPLEIIDPVLWQGQAVPPRRWIVPGWVPVGVTTGLYGSGGLGKSLLALQLMTAAAIGRPWLGVPVEPVKSFGVFCEDDQDELHRRQDAINRLYGCDYADLGNMRLQARAGAASNVLMTFKDGVGQGSALLYDLGVKAREFGAKLFVFDTLADGFAGSQNDMGQARQFVQALTRLARYIDGAVILVAHPSRAGRNDDSGESGSVQWDAALRSRLYLATPKLEDGEVGDPDARILTRKKANYASRDEAIAMHWHRGVFVSEAAANGARPDAETVFLGLLDELTSERQWVSHSNRAGNYAPKLFTRRPGRQGYRVADFERAMHSLFEQREIELADYQHDRKTRQRIARVAVAPELPF